MQFPLFLRRVGSNVQKARWLAGLTQEEAAARSELTYRHFQELERGEVNPTLRTLFQLSQALGRTVAELVDVTPPPKGKPRPRLMDTEAEPPPRGRRPALDRSRPRSRR